MSTHQHTPESTQRAEGCETGASPVRIFLQWNGDQEPDPTQTPGLAEVTWCADRVFEHDVEYLRADKVRILIDALYGLAMPCTRADYSVRQLDEVVSRLAKSALDNFAKSVDDCEKTASGPADAAAFFASGWARLDRSSAARGWNIDDRARISRRAKIAKIRLRKIPHESSAGTAPEGEAGHHSRP